MDFDGIDGLLVRANALLEATKGRRDIPPDITEVLDVLRAAKGAWPEQDVRPFGYGKAGRNNVYALGLQTDQPFLVRSVSAREGLVRLYGKGKSGELRPPPLRHQAEADMRIECWKVLLPREVLFVGSDVTDPEWKVRGYPLERMTKIRS